MCLEQIRIDELPVDYFISNRPYPSDNYRFNISTFGMDSEGNEWIKDDFKDKHIQLVAANPSLKGNHLAWLDDDEYAYDGLMAETFGLKPETKDEVRNWKIQGKDFFIYRVSKKK